MRFSVSDTAFLVSLLDPCPVNPSKLVTTTELMKTAVLNPLRLSSLPPFSHAGHTLTGQVAQLFLTPETAKQVKEILSPYYDGLLSKAAPWPDTIKGQAKYR